MNTSKTKVLTEEAIKNSPLNDNIKQLLLSIKRGEKLIPLTSDIMSKNVLSPDLHPERFDFLVQRVMKNANLIADKSCTNEIPLENYESKKLITDISAWLADSELATIEMQALAQEFIFKRADLLTSRMLMLQYSAKNGQKGTVNFDNVPGVVLVVLMKESPNIFKSHDSSRYIHRVTNAKSDTGMTFPLLRQIAFVQLDSRVNKDSEK
ncbi:PD-(D/E)XK nuclease family transposase [Butyrivibrio proteoclasticus]|uniref:PD-(D/E)XK nuclease family transposase n=1 Tax=Butyrivibrio proteoclasticus TaxID=43305 RepID=UPI00047958E3|nr:PD-(D/E)XK nuclease family transposase [Butyrivibrio proteoclasticus]